ncbi:MAG: CHASE domain-containing protein, partial [Gammaproteobacteria bacterium]|nr:CHASE domain-containing protein [Gammaproteobacteria bacterium]
MDRVSHTAFSRRERWFFGLLALFLMGSTALAVLRIGVDDANERLQARIDVAHELLTQRIANGSGSLASLAGLHQASHNLTPSELTSLAEQLLQRHQYFSHIAYVALVSHDERQEFEYEMHTSTSADYVIKAQASARGAPSPPKKTYLPITFVEPMTPYSARMLGLDLKPHKTIGRAINDAVRTGEEAAEPTEIFSGKPGLVLVQPTYYGTFRPNEAEERAAQLSGAFLLVIRWDKLLAQLDEAEHLSIGARRAPLQKREFSSLDVLRKKQLTATRVLHVDGARLTLSLEDDLHAGELNWQWASVAALVVGALCIAIVATLRHRKLARLEVERSKEMFFDLIDGSVQGIFIHRDGTMLFANQSFCDVLGYENPHELLKTPNIADHIAEQERQRLMEYRRSRSDGRAPTHYEFKALKRDGSEVLLENSVRVIDWHGAPAIQCTIADITERKAAENALIEVSERALSAARAKSEFLANISHELRTPLNGVCGMLQLLGSSDLETEQQDFVTVATTSSNTLLSLIDDILDFSRLESGRLELQYEPFDIRQWVHHVAAHLADAAQSKGVEFVTSVDIDVPEIIECDPKRLQQVLINLIGNASKFTEAGAIVLAVQVTETQTPDEVELVLSVSDTGIGIARDDQQKIFESFTQADGSTT